MGSRQFWLLKLTDDNVANTVTPNSTVISFQPSGGLSYRMDFLVTMALKGESRPILSVSIASPVLLPLCTNTHYSGHHSDQTMFSYTAHLTTAATAASWPPCPSSPEVDITLALVIHELISPVPCSRLHDFRNNFSCHLALSS